ncbi:MAG: DNA mismatch repair endonuclease MutL [Eubacterium sp.]|nr:DNA mismatch repair endonuclease MutL [Eubacterium sp.]
MIRVLEKTVADKIAAGEVIERPVSIVKELVENSIDAGATEITVEIRKGGRELIRVTDNGSGIPSDDCERAFLRHATSKIVKAEDLRKLTTLGFRGEALASIAAVTRTELITKTREEKTGTRLVIHGGETVLKEAVGCPEGTSFLITDLFYNTPARSKFLKSEGAESGLVIDMISRLALTRTDIRFRLVNNGTMVFTTTGRGDLLKTITAVYKEREFKDLVPVRAEGKGLTVFGYISRPTLTRTNRRSQYFFVNGRPVSSKPLEKAVDSGYKERLFEGRHPIVFLFLEASPASLDVNIHPNKKEVRFDDEIAVMTLVRDAIVAGLAGKQAVGKVEDTFPVQTEQKNPRRSEQGTQVDVKTFLSTLRNEEAVKESLRPAAAEEPAADRVAEPAFRYEAKSTAAAPEEDDFPEVPEVVEVRTPQAAPAKERAQGGFDLSAPANPPFDLESLRLGEILFGTYITATDDSSFYLIDQHAAHERVNYERFVGAYLSSEKLSQLLLIPFTCDVPREMAADDAEWTGILRDMGYAVENFGENTYIFREIPQFVTLEEAEGFVHTFVDSFMEGIRLNNRVVIDKLITKSCKSAIKAHDYIKPEEAEALLKDLKQCRNPFSCPHGRPVFIRFTVREIERMFKRII